MGKFFKMLTSFTFCLVFIPAVCSSDEMPPYEPVVHKAKGEELPASSLMLCQMEESLEIEFEEDDWPERDEEVNYIADPFEPVNRVFFHFNDKLYFWVLKPVSTGYEKAFPEQMRISVRNFFSNLYTPIRAVNCLLQGKPKGFGTEISRFLLNSTIGVLGFGDPGKKIFNLNIQDEDLGQTLGLYGLAPVFFINWPILGPSSLRDTAGLAGDSFLNPLNYLLDATKYNVAAKSYEKVNSSSMTLGEYESFKKAAMDPYVSMRDAYHQYRQNKIKK